MKLDNNQLEAAAYFFEKSNGNLLEEFELEMIENAAFSDQEMLEQTIIEGLQIGLYEDEESRTNAYWALSKTGNKNLVPLLKKWLKYELGNNSQAAIFQLLINLDKLGETVFPKYKTSRDVREQKLHEKFAKQYLLEN